MIFNTNQLIDELKKYTEHHIAFSRSILELTEETLQFKNNAKSWSVLECLEHLNRYSDFYNPEITKRIHNSDTIFNAEFKSGFLGNKFALDMLPKKGMKTMNTFKSKNPINSNLNKQEVISKFIRQEEELLAILDLAKSKNLTEIKTAITLPLLKFRLGDTFRFVIYHNERHIIQAQKVLKFNNLH